MKKLLRILICLMALLTLLALASCDDEDTTESSSEENSSEETESTYVKISFNSDGGTPIEDISILNGEKLTDPPSDPQKNGYIFEYWYLEGNPQRIWNFGSNTITKDITLVAKWKPRSFIVSYKNVYGENSNPTKVTIEDKITLKPLDNREYYTFKGWYSDPGFTSAVTELSATESNIVLYARYDYEPLKFELQDDGTYSVVGCDPNATAVVIPLARDNVPVTKIGDSAFLGCTQLKSVTITEHVRYIDGAAFYGCESLKSIKIPSNVTTIGSAAFAYCTALTSVELQGSVELIGDMAFFGATALASINLPQGLERIGDMAFYGTAIRSALVPDTVTHIGMMAFAYCTRLDEVLLPDSVKYVGTNAFAFCALEPEAYGGGLYINNWLVGVESTDITSITLRPSTIGIYNHALAGCELLEEVIISDKIEFIGEGAFEDSPSIQFEEYGNALYLNNWLISAKDETVTEVTLKPSTAGIYFYAFYGCQDLVKITAGENSLNYTTIDGNLYSKDKSTLVAYAPGKADSEFIVPTDVREIGDFAFRGSTSLKVASIHDSVESIGASAFRQCASIKYIEIPLSVSRIGEYAFYACTSIEQIYCEIKDMPITWSILWVGDDALDSVVFDTIAPEKKSYSGIDYELMLDGTYKVVGAINGVSNMEIFETINGRAVRVIESEAFADRVTLKSLIIPKSVVEIGERAFRGCTVLERITVDADNPVYMSLDSGLYTKDKSTLILHLSDSERTIGVVPYGTDTILSYAFENATGIDTVIITQSVKVIEKNAFSGSSITSIVIPDTVTEIEENAFDACTSLQFISAVAQTAPTGWSENLLGDSTATITYGFNDQSHESANKYIKDLNIQNSALGVVTIYGYTGDELNITIPDTYNGEPIREIGMNAFKESQIEGITLTNNIVQIGINAFKDCSALKTINIGSKIWYIRIEAFDGCIALEQINVDDNNEYYKSVDGVLYDKTGETLLRYTTGSTATSFTVPSGVTKIGDHAFANALNLKSIIVSEGVTSLGSAIVRGSEVEQMDLPSTLTNINYYAFDSDDKVYEECGGALYVDNWLIRAASTDITEVTIKEGTIGIVLQAFYRCTKLESIIIPNSVLYVSSTIFYGCDLKNIYCEAPERPSGWEVNWSFNAGDDAEIVWGYTK